MCQSSLGRNTESTRVATRLRYVQFEAAETGEAAAKATNGIDAYHACFYVPEIGHVYCITVSLFFLK
jgi:hypothetical protein